jgi:hypothetical protein
LRIARSVAEAHWFRVSGIDSVQRASVMGDDSPHRVEVHLAMIPRVERVLGAFKLNDENLTQKGVASRQIA